MIPTLGTRPEFLANAISSIRSAGEAHILLVAPEEKKSQLESLGIDQFEIDPGKGLVEAINLGFSKLPSDIEYVNWLGDDDELTPNSLAIASSIMDKDPRAPFAFGGCGYVDEAGRLLWTNNSGIWAIPLLRFGPDLIPQPGALIRKTALEKILPLDSSYKFAFDFDMFIKLSRLGKPVFVPRTLANFRWHSDSLTVSQRRLSALEASRVRKSHLPKGLKTISELWEAPVRFATNVLGAKMLKRKQKTKS